jgi:hypothetical protein
MDRSLAPSVGMGKSNMLWNFGSSSRISGEEYFDQDVGHRLRVLSNGLDLFIRQFRGFIVQKLAASSEAVSFGIRFEVGDVAHTRPLNALVCGTLRAIGARTIT